MSATSVQRSPLCLSQAGRSISSKRRSRHPQRRRRRSGGFARRKGASPPPEPGWRCPADSARGPQRRRSRRCGMGSRGRTGAAVRPASDSTALKRGFVRQKPGEGGGFAGAAEKQNFESVAWIKGAGDKNDAAGAVADHIGHWRRRCRGAEPGGAASAAGGGSGGRRQAASGAGRALDHGAADALAEPDGGGDGNHPGAAPASRWWCWLRAIRFATASARCWPNACRLTNFCLCPPPRPFRWRCRAWAGRCGRPRDDFLLRPAVGASGAVAAARAADSGLVSGRDDAGRRRELFMRAGFWRVRCCM